MTAIRILRNTGANLPRFTEGQVVDVPADTAALLCGLALAEVLETTPPAPLRAVPENPTILAAEEKLQEIKQRWTAPPQPPKPKRQSKHRSESKE